MVEPVEPAAQQSSLPTAGWRYKLGLGLFFGAFPIFFATPVVMPMLGLSAAESAALIGGILLAVELLWFASIPLLGKEGFKAVKDKAFGWLKLKSGPISHGRHRFGVLLLVGSLVIDLLLQLLLMYGHFAVASTTDPTPVILGLSFTTQTNLYVALQIATGLGFLASFFVLGGDFWERLKSAFEWHPGTLPIR